MWCFPLRLFFPLLSNIIGIFWGDFGNTLKWNFLKCYYNKAIDRRFLGINERRDLCSKDLNTSPKRSPLAPAPLKWCWFLISVLDSVWSGHSFNPAPCSRLKSANWAHMLYGPLVLRMIGPLKSRGSSIAKLIFLKSEHRSPNKTPDDWLTQ